MDRFEHFLPENWEQIQQVMSVFRGVSLLKEKKQIEDTFPKTNSKFDPAKMMVGRRSFPFRKANFQGLY